MITYKILNPRFVQVKRPPKTKQIKPGAPPMEVLRFDVIFECTDVGSELHGIRIDGHLLTYHVKSDNLQWRPPMCGSFNNTRVIWPSKAWSEEIEKALGFPHANPGWNDGTDPDAERRVAEGYYLKMLVKARRWREKWWTEKVAPVKPRSERKLRDEIKEYLGDD